MHLKSVTTNVRKKNTMTKHVNTKHSQLHKCYTCREMFNIKDFLEVHKEKVHGEEETVRDTSLVFSESMLDKFL